MSTGAALLILGVTAASALAVQFSCMRLVPCPCGKSGENITICFRENGAAENPCRKWAGCKKCQDGLDECLECPEGFEGPFCEKVAPQETKYRRKRQNDPSIHRQHDAASQSNRMGFRNGPTGSAAQQVSGRGIVYCDNPGSISNGRIRYISPTSCSRSASRVDIEDMQEFPEAALLEYNCNDGYSMKGHFALRCEPDGMWSSSPPNCSAGIPDDFALYCDKPTCFSNGRITYYPPGSASSVDIRNIQEFPEDCRLEYSCAEGYRLEGSSSRQCSPNGMWRSSAPICEIECGNSSKRLDGKITNGTKTEVGEWPWIVGIAVKEGKANRIICGGALINSNTIVTAAHCLTGRNSFILYFGKYHRYDRNDDTEVERRQSEMIIIHPDYDRPTMDSDIGLVTFSPPISFTERIQPICLPATVLTTVNNVKAGNIGYVTGWGLDERKRGSDKLLLAHLPVLRTDVCIESFRKQNISINSNMFCAGFKEGGQNVCSGDSGSPMVFYDAYKGTFTLEGLVSFAAPGQCGIPERYSVFTKVFRFVSWIHENTQCRLVECGRPPNRRPQQDIVGTKTDVGDWPWVVAIAPNVDNSYINCQGALINSNTIVTVAHCLTIAKSFILYFGKYHRHDSNDDAEVERRLSEIIITHPDFDRQTMDSDIGLVTFSPPISFTERIQPICLPTTTRTTAKNLQPGNRGYVTGWWLTASRLPAEELLVVRLPVVTNDTCTDSYRRKNAILQLTSNMFCAGLEEGGENVCKGSGGSPMVFYDEHKGKYTVEGLVSFAIRGQCRQPDRYSIFTKVFQFVPWILHNTKIT